MPLDDKAPIASGAVPETSANDVRKEEDAPGHAVLAAPKKKEPPPEKAESIRLRIYVILSFWAIIILVGLPIWWWTTSIYRANLPLAQMMDWADGRVPFLPSCCEIQMLTTSGLSTSIPSSNIN